MQGAKRSVNVNCCSLTLAEFAEVQHGITVYASQ